MFEDRQGFHAFNRSSAKTKAVAAVPLGFLDEYNLKTGSIPVSWRRHTLGIAVHNKGSPLDGLLFHHIWGKRNNRPGLPQNRLPDHVLRHLFLDPYHDLFQLPDLLVLFRLLLAFYLPPFYYFVSYLKTLCQGFP
jgi:hypothetical protein